MRSRRPGTWIFAGSRTSRGSGLHHRIGEFSQYQEDALGIGHKQPLRRKIPAHGQQPVLIGVDRIGEKRLGGQGEDGHGLTWRESEIQLPGVREADMHFSTGSELAEQDLLGQRVLDFLLDQTPQGPGPEGRVKALLASQERASGERSGARFWPPAGHPVRP